MDAKFLVGRGWLSDYGYTFGWSPWGSTMEEPVHISAFGPWAKYWMRSPEGVGGMNLMWLEYMPPVSLSLPDNAFDTLDKIYLLINNGKDVFTTEILETDVHAGDYSFLDDSEEEYKVFQTVSGSLCEIKLSTKPFV